MVESALVGIKFLIGEEADTARHAHAHEVRGVVVPLLERLIPSLEGGDLVGSEGSRLSGDRHTPGVWDPSAVDLGGA